MRTKHRGPFSGEQKRNLFLGIVSIAGRDKFPRTIFSRAAVIQRERSSPSWVKHRTFSSRYFLKTSRLLIASFGVGMIPLPA